MKVNLHNESHPEKLKKLHKAINRTHQQKSVAPLKKLGKRIIEPKNPTRVIIFLELLGVLLLTLIYLSPLNRINRVMVTGNRMSTKEVVETNVEVHSGSSLSYLFLHQGHLKQQALHRDIQLKQIKFHFLSHRNVKISAKVYPIVGYLQRGKHKYIVLTNGRIADRSSNVRKNLPQLVGAKKHSQALHLYAKSFMKIPANIRYDMAKVTFSPTNIDPHRVLIQMNDGNKVEADLTTWQGKMKYYPSIAESMKKKGIINIEVGAYSYPKKH